MSANESRVALARQLCVRLMRLAHEGRDEIAVIDGFVLRLELGFNNYGPLDLRRDRRDYGIEGDEELADWMAYKAMQRTSVRLAQVDQLETGFEELRGAFDLSDEVR